jgi:tetratricopeptide (TPR) repeat protein
MGRVEKTVFISYRRTNVSWALAIFQDLTQHGYDVFFDYNGVASGDFEQVILGNITARAHFLVLLTPSALERCGEPGDWLRREIETALNSRRNIVPLTLDGFDFGRPGIASQLTGTLATLKDYNALSIPPEYFSEAMGRLRDRYLNVPLDAVLQPASLPARQTATEHQAAAGTAPVVKEAELTAQQWFERGYEATDPCEEERLYSQAIRLKPDYYGAFINRGMARHEKGDVAGALEDFDEAVRLRPGDAVAFNIRAIVRSDHGDVDGALADYDEAIRLKPDDADTFNGRGNARTAKGDVDGALADYAEAIRLRPDFQNAFYNRGLARARAGRDGALEDFNEAIRLKPGDAEAIYDRAIVRGGKGDVEGALADYSEAIRLKPDYADAFNNRGIARSGKGDAQGAVKDYSEAIRLKPDYASAFNNRGVARKDLGDQKGALEDYTEAIRLKPDYAEAFHNRAEARRENGDEAGALEDDKEAIRLGYKGGN